MGQFKKFTKHDMGEIGGLALGGILHSGVNDLMLKFWPKASNQLSGLLGNFSGAIAPLALGLITGMIADKGIKGAAMKKGVDQLAKGLIGASVAGLGSTIYTAGKAMMPGRLGAIGVQQQRYLDGLDYDSGPTGFGGIENQDQDYFGGGDDFDGDEDDF